jgi:peptidoglycan/LPS O-acetylase OafA/YrhL
MIYLPQNKIEDNKIYFENLNSIRFIAASMVFLQHGMSNSYKFLPIKNTYWEKILNLISEGGTGVSIFFVLSGFLITYLLISEFELNGRIVIKFFYIKRMLRIWPLYFAIILFSFGIYPFLLFFFGIKNHIDTNIIYHIFFLSNFDTISIMKLPSGNGDMVQGITWSVSIEEQFYLFWPLLFAFAPYRFWGYLIMLTIAGSVAFRIVHYNDTIVLYYHSFSVLLDLGIGGLFAYLIKEYSQLKFFFENITTKTHLFFFLLSFLLLLHRDELFDFKYGNALSRFFISISFVFIICAQAFTKSNSIINLKYISFANTWGKYTYGIYLIHPICILAVTFFAKNINFPKDNFINNFIMGITSFTLTLIISKISYRNFELKFLRIKDKFTIINTEG